MGIVLTSIGSHAGTVYEYLHDVIPEMFVILTRDGPAREERFNETFVMDPFKSLAFRVNTTFVLLVLLTLEGVAAMLVTTIPVK